MYTHTSIDTLSFRTSASIACSSQRWTSGQNRFEESANPKAPCAHMTSAYIEGLG